MRQLIVYPCFLTPLPYWFQWFASHPAHRNRVPLGLCLLARQWQRTLGPATFPSRTSRSAAFPGAHSISPGCLHTQPGLSRFRPRWGMLAECWKEQVASTLQCPKSLCPLLRVSHGSGPAASLHSRSVLLLPNPQCRLWDRSIHPEPFRCYRAHTSPAQSLWAAARSPSKYSKFCTTFQLRELHLTQPLHLLVSNTVIIT